MNNKQKLIIILIILLTAISYALLVNRKNRRESASQVPPMQTGINNQKFVADEIETELNSLEKDLEKLDSSNEFNNLEDL